MQSTPPLIDIYIIIKYKGNFANGVGDCAIVLETIIHNILKTKRHFYGWRETTNNRLILHACIKALSHIKVPSQIVFHVTSPYISNSINDSLKVWENQNWKTKKAEPVKNADLWQQYKELTKKHSITAVLEMQNRYTNIMIFELDKSKYSYIEDYRQENLFN